MSHPPVRIGAITQISLKNNQKDGLYRRGCQCTKDFFLNEWDWK